MEPDSASVAENLGQVFGTNEWIGDITQVNPAVAAGLAQLTEVVTRDGALPAGVKLLYVAAIAATKQQGQLAVALLREAMASGLAQSQAYGAAAALLVSRGVPALAVFLDALRQVEGPIPEGTAPAQAPGGTGSALDYVKSIYGEVPARIRLMIDQLPGALAGFNLLRSAGLRGAGLTPKHSELLLVAINSALYEPGFVESHARDARDEGATETELAEAVATAIPLGGMAAWSCGATAVESSRSKGSRRGGS